MKRIECLPEITEHIFSGLKADEKLKHRILLSAASGSPSARYPLRTVVFLCSLSILLVLICVFALQPKGSGNIQVIPAGSRYSSPPVHLETVLEKALEISEP